MLQKIISFLKPKQPTGHPYNVSDVDVHLLRAFRNSPQFTELCNFIDTYAAYQAEIMLQTEEPNRLQYMRGYIAALRHIPIVVDNVCKERVSNGAVGERNNASRTVAATYGTSAWKHGV